MTAPALAQAAQVATATDPTPTLPAVDAPVAPAADHTVPAPAMAVAPYGPDALPQVVEEPTDEETDIEPSPLAAACAAGTVRLFRLRSSGTTRRIPWLTGDALETAEWYRLQLDEGLSVRQMAEDCATSKATVRRALTTLALMDEVTEGLHDDAWSEGVTEIMFSFSDEGDEA